MTRSSTLLPNLIMTLGNLRAELEARTHLSVCGQGVGELGEGQGLRAHRPAHNPPRPHRHHGALPPQGDRGRRPHPPHRRGLLTGQGRTGGGVRDLGNCGLGGVRCRRIQHAFEGVGVGLGVAVRLKCVSLTCAASLDAAGTGGEVAGLHPLREPTAAGLAGLGRAAGPGHGAGRRRLPGLGRGKAVEMGVGGWGLRLSGRGLFPVMKG